MDVVITANGHGTRMQSFGVPKHEITYKGRRICDYVLDTFPNALLATHHPTKWPNTVLRMQQPHSRLSTIQQICRHGVRKDVLIIDCDIVFPKLIFDERMFENNFIYYFESKLNKYGSFTIKDGYLSMAVEGGNLQNKSSGIYFIKDLRELSGNMIDLRTDSILEGMTRSWTRCYKEDVFIRLGDMEDYTQATHE